MKETLRPEYYKKDNSIEVVKFTNSHNSNFNIANTAKYIVRSPYKDPDLYLLDLGKGLQYLRFEQEKLKHFNFGEVYLKECGIDLYSFIESHNLNEELEIILEQIFNFQNIDHAVELLQKYLDKF